MFSTILNIISASPSSSWR